MSDAFIVRRGGGSGGGGGLNFSVVGGTSAPSKPTDNLIWINTSTSVTSWVFRGSEPETQTEGIVWIQTNTNETNEFNAIKKNSILLNVVIAWQYVSGAWQKRYAQRFSAAENKWIPLWNGELYTAGNTWDGVTGGFVGKAVLATSATTKATGTPTIQIDSNNRLYVDTKTKDVSGMVHTAKQIDTTDFTTLRIKGIFSHGGSVTTNLIVGLWDKIPSKYYASSSDGLVSSKVIETSTTEKEYTLPIPSGGGQYYIGLGLVISTATITDFVLE